MSQACYHSRKKVLHHSGAPHDTRYSRCVYGSVIVINHAARFASARIFIIWLAATDDVVKFSKFKVKDEEVEVPIPLPEDIESDEYVAQLYSTTKVDISLLDGDFHAVLLNLVI